MAQDLAQALRLQELGVLYSSAWGKRSQIQDSLVGGDSGDRDDGCQVWMQGLPTDSL